MVNLEKFYAIAKPRDEKAHKKFMLMYKYRFFIHIWQDLQLFWYKLAGIAQRLVCWLPKPKMSVRF